MKNSKTTTSLDAELHDLLDAWNAHQELHDNGAPLADLWRSREVLDQRRLSVHLAA